MPTSAFSTQELPRTQLTLRPVGGAARLRLAPFAITLALVAVFAVLAAFVVQRRRAPTLGEASDPPLAILTVEDGGWRYVLHAPTGTESLYRLAEDPKCRRNLIDQEPDRTEDMRRELLRRSKAQSIEDLREPHRRTIEALKSLGYL